ncbi:MAG: TetR/AcrR family transcriptional regulator [Nocardiopsaceae bacterium]|jgi:AcrR family transcriptional regulator|nr:TetR/AcrR family transcriptional regulator [Nocardiopsaceae bacterium]
MTSTTAGRRTGRLRRGSLTPETIVEESLRLLDTEGADGFSLPKLGRALGADPTAVYRHFASKDDLVLAIADRLIEEAMTGFVAHDCWVDTLIESTRRLRTTYRAHPAAAALSASRTTQRPAEMSIVNALIGAMLQAGFTGAEAARMYRAIGDFTLSWAGGEATFLALDPSQQQADISAWTKAYLAVDRNEYPHIWQLRDELAEVTEDDIFETILRLVIQGFMVLAPRPCECGKHEQAASRPGREPPSEEAS